MFYKRFWEETFTMSEEKEDWDDLDATLMDGLEDENPAIEIKLETCFTFVKKPYKLVI